MKLCVFAAVVSLVAYSAFAADRRKFTVDDLFRVERIADPQISPDGRWVVYVQTAVHFADNSTSSNLWLVPAAGGEPRRLTATAKKDKHPRWSPDGAKILFESNRSGESQLWIIDVAGGEARQHTTLASEAANAVWSPDGKSIAFVSAVYPEHSDKPFAESNAAHKARKESIEKNPVKARVFTKLFYRHWDDWVGDKRQHLFVVPADGGDPRDVTPGDRDAYPTSTTFSVGDDFTFSPDSQALVYTAVPEKNEAWSTNFDVLKQPLAGGAPTCLTCDNPAADSAPAFSPDGSKLAYRAQRKPQYEADRWELIVADPDGKNPKSLTADLDRSVENFLWAPDGKSLYFLAEENARTPVFRVDLQGKTEKVLESHAIANLSISRDGRSLAFVRSAMTFPPEVCVASIDPAGSVGPVKVLTHANDKLLAELDLPTPQSVTGPGAGGTPMQMWILHPPGFDPSRKWPLIYLVHGGPQGAWQDSWNYRWNPQIWAAQGYVVAMPNPRGSTGFGQKYVDEISGDWGGKCFEDLMLGVANLEKLPYIDSSRMAAAGASFGGYMMNWFEGHTDKFKTLVCHCGVYNFDTMYATTDELWFDEWEHGGPPWGNRASYEKHSPHLFAGNFKTPMLIIHNDLDFRVPVHEGLSIFTVLQRRGVPSKLINFPDESHWVLKPANSAFWHREIFSWIAKYAPPGPR